MNEKEKQKAVDDDSTAAKLVRYVIERNVSGADAVKMGFGVGYEKGYDAGRSESNKVAVCDECPHEAFNPGYQQRCEGCGHTREYIDGYTAGRSVQGWVKCSDRLPDNDGYFLTVYGTLNGREVLRLFYKSRMRSWMFGGTTNFADGVTAWMPLPPPYEGE